MLSRSIFFCIFLCLVGCSQEEKPLPDAPPTVYRQNSYELNLLTEKLPDGRRVFTLNKTLFVGGQNLRRAIISIDTLPALGQENAEVVNENDDGSSYTQYTKADKEYDVLFKVDTLKYFDPSDYSWDTAAHHTSESLNKSQHGK